MFKLRNLFVGALFSLVMVFGFAMTAQACDWCDDEFSYLDFVYSIEDLSDDVLEFLENGYTIHVVDYQFVLVCPDGYIVDCCLELPAPRWIQPCCGWTGLIRNEFSYEAVSDSGLRWWSSVGQRYYTIFQRWTITRATYTEIYNCTGAHGRSWTEFVSIEYIESFLG